MRALQYKARATALNGVSSAREAVQRTLAALPPHMNEALMLMRRRLVNAGQLNKEEEGGIQVDIGASRQCCELVDELAYDSCEGWQENLSVVP